MTNCDGVFWCAPSALDGWQFLQQLQQITPANMSEVPLWKGERENPQRTQIIQMVCGVSYLSYLTCFLFDVLLKDNPPRFVFTPQFTFPFSVFSDVIKFKDCYKTALPVIFWPVA